MMFSLIMFSWSAMDGHFKREVLQMQSFRGGVLYETTNILIRHYDCV